MALPTNNSRPAIPYVPTQILPNYNRYESLGNFPPTAQQFDGDLNAIMDFINTLADAINNTAAGIFPGADEPLNANKLPTTDGAGNVSWTLINAINLSPNSVQTQHITNAAVTSDKIQLQAIGTNQIADGSVLSAKIGAGTIQGTNIANYAIPLSKLALPNAPACILGSTTTGGGYLYYQSLSPWLVPTGRTQDNGVTSQTLDVIWSNTANTFTGAKITPNTITGSQIAPASVPLSDLVSSQQSCVIAGTSANNTYYELSLGDWQLPVKRAQDYSPTARTLDVIWSNTTGTFDGGKLTLGSVPFSALVSVPQPNSFAPFCMGLIQSNGAITKSINLAAVTRTSQGNYRIVFNTSTPNANYIVTFGNEDNGGNPVTNAYVAQGSRTINGFNVVVQGSSNGAWTPTDEGFNFVVYAF